MRLFLYGGLSEVCCAGDPCLLRVHRTWNQMITWGRTWATIMKETKRKYLALVSLLPGGSKGLRRNYWDASKIRIRTEDWLQRLDQWQEDRDNNFHQLWTGDYDLKIQPVSGSRLPDFSCWEMADRINIQKRYSLNPSTNSPQRMESSRQLKRIQVFMTTGYVVGEHQCTTVPRKSLPIIKTVTWDELRSPKSRL